MRACPRRRGRHRPGAPSGGDVCVAHRIVSYCEFKHTIEHHPTAPGVASVEAEHELVQVGGKMRVIDRSLMGTQQPPLGQRGNPMHRGQ